MMVFNGALNVIMKGICMKAKAEKRIDVPAGFDFDAFTDEIVNKALNAPEKYNLKKKEIEFFKDMGPLEREIIADALEVAAKDGLYSAEIAEILGDLPDLVEASTKRKSFDAMMKDPTNEKFELTEEMAEVIQGLSAAQKEELYEDLHKFHEGLGHKIIAFFKKIGEAILPVLQSVAAKMIEIGAEILGNLVNKEIDGPVGDILEAGVDNVGDALADAIKPEVDEMKVNDLDGPAAVAPVAAAPAADEAPVVAADEAAPVVAADEAAPVVAADEAPVVAADEAPVVAADEAAPVVAADEAAHIAAEAVAADAAAEAVAAAAAPAEEDVVVAGDVVEDAAV